MRKVLFASTALVAFGATAGVQAAEPITLKVGGFAQELWGYANQSNDGPAATNINGGAGNGSKRNNIINRDNVEIWFTGSTKLDNGLTVAVRVELEGGAASNSSQIDEANITVSGGFGRLILGAEDNVSQLMMNLAPDVGYGTGYVENFWAVQPNNWTSMTITPLNSAYADDSDVNKITYITPSFFGFQAGYTYVPNWARSNYATGSTSSDAAGMDSHVAAISYNNKFGDVGFKADLGGYASNGAAGLTAAGAGAGAQGSTGVLTFGGGGTSTAAVKGWRAGTNVSFAGFTVGGHYWKQYQDQRTDPGGVTTPISREGEHWAVGVAYETGPWAVSGTYAHEKTKGNLLIAGDDTYSQYSVAGKYILGPGIDVMATYQHWNFGDETHLSQNENKVNMVLTGIRVAF